MQEIIKYRAFHGREPSVLSKIDFNVPEKLVYLGKAVAIEYSCKKRNGGGDGRMATYRHTFKGGVILAMDKSAKKQLYIIGKNVRVTSSGIEN